jgi:hypothetical protein
MEEEDEKQFRLCLCWIASLLDSDGWRDGWDDSFQESLRMDDRLRWFLSRIDGLEASP